MLDFFAHSTSSLHQHAYSVLGSIVVQAAIIVVISVIAIAMYYRNA